MFWKNANWIKLNHAQFYFTYRTIRWCLNKQQSNVKLSNSPPSPQTLIPYFSAYKKKPDQNFSQQNNDIYDAYKFNS
jgi:hypothetical protein